ncbi:MAG: hypothetical protein ACTHQ3_02735 [Motilibacteraceae bacterium]
MSKMSMASAATHERLPGVMTSAEQQMDGWTISIESYESDQDFSFMFKGAPGDMCQVGHLGYVVKGEMELRYADGSVETLQAGDAGVIPPGHVPIFHQGCEVLIFTRSDEAERDMAAVMPNMQTFLAARGLTPERW